MSSRIECPRCKETIQVHDDSIRCPVCERRIACTQEQYNAYKQTETRIMLWVQALMRSQELLRESKQRVKASLKENNSFVYEALVELAIVYFCQVINSGKEVENLVAANDYKSFVKLHWNGLKNIAFAHDELLEFEKLVRELKYARDKMIGHADGEAFDIHIEQNVLTVFNKYSESWKGINVDFWLDCINKLVSSSGDYIRQYKAVYFDSLD